MLEPRHIVKLHIPLKNILAYKKVPPPSCIKTEQSHLFVCLSDAILANIFNINPETFIKQLPTARSLGVELVLSNGDKTIGFSAFTSKIAPGSVLRKNLIVPTKLLVYTPKTDKHIIIGAFMEKQPKHQAERFSEYIYVAGWADANDVKYWGTKPIDAFKSKLNSVCVPCAQLHPINDLVEQYKTATVNVI